MACRAVCEAFSFENLAHNSLLEALYYSNSELFLTPNLPKKAFLRKITTLLPQLCRSFLTHAVKMPTRCGTIFQGNFQVKTSADSYFRAKTAQKWVVDSYLVQTIFSYLPKTNMLFFLCLNITENSFLS